MMSSNEHDISVLNSLIKTTLDSRKGFRDAAEEATSSRFSEMFAEFAAERGAVASRLQQEVRRLGGDPEDDSGLLAAAHRAFMDLKASLSGNDDKAVINEVERGEDYIKAKYETALKDEDLSPTTRQLITECFTSVRAGHDRASALKHGAA
jgi:uncharacterized protein (TIGR02284 family)